MTTTEISAVELDDAPATFSPAPWSQDHAPRKDGGYATQIFDNAGSAIAYLTWAPRPEVDGVIGTYREANAALMAAAPEMFDVLGWLKSYAEVQVRNHPNGPETAHWQKLLDVYAKAEGRS
jgi:hypothetical protein